MLHWVRAANQLVAHSHALSLTVEFWRHSLSPIPSLMHSKQWKEEESLAT